MPAARRTPAAPLDPIVADLIADLPPCLDIAAAAKVLGVSHMTIRRRIDAGTLRALKVGAARHSRTVIPRAALAQYLELCLAD